MTEGKKVKNYLTLRFASPAPRDFQILCQQLYALLTAGFPLVAALLSVAENSRNLRLRTALKEIAGQISQGKDWEESLRSFSHILPQFLINMLILGKEAGSLPAVLNLLEGHYNRLYFIKRTILSIVRYPIVLIFFYYPMLFLIK